MRAVLGVSSPRVYKKRPWRRLAWTGAMFGLLALNSGGGGKCKPIDDDKQEDVNRLGTFIKKQLDAAPPDFDPDYFCPFDNPLAHIGDPRRKFCVKRLSVAQRHAVELAMEELDAARDLAKMRNRIAMRKAERLAAQQEAEKRPVKNLSQFVKEEVAHRKRQGGKKGVPRLQMTPASPGATPGLYGAQAPAPAPAVASDEAMNAALQAGDIQTIWTQTLLMMGFEAPPPTPAVTFEESADAAPTPAKQSSGGMNFRKASSAALKANADSPPGSAPLGASAKQLFPPTPIRGAATTPRKQRPPFAESVTPRTPTRVDPPEDGGWFGSSTFGSFFAASPKAKETPEKLKDRFFSPRGQPSPAVTPRPVHTASAPPSSRLPHLATTPRVRGAYLRTPRGSGSQSARATIRV